MRASPNDQRAANRLASILFAGLFAGRIMLTPAILAAQQPGPPIPLIPPSSASSPDLPLTLPGHNAAVASEPLAPPAAGWNPGTPPPRGALPEAFWRGTSRGVADVLLALLPDTTSLALQSLERRLLLSSGAAPEGPDADNHQWSALRAGALLRLGELDAARAVVAAIPEQERAPGLPLAVAADATGGDIRRACATVRDMVRRDQARFWQTALIACQALQGETEQARLGLQLLGEEQQGPRDEVLAAAIETLAGRPPAASIDRADPLDPLSLRLLVAARWELKPAFVDTLRPDLALCLALDERAPSATRLAAAERAARYGALSPDRLRGLYSTLVIAGEPGDLPALSHTRRFAAIAEAATPAERVARIVSFVDAFSGRQGGGGLALAARLVLPALREIVPDSSLAASAPRAARLLIAAGDIRAARRWAELVSEDEERPIRFLLALAAPRADLAPDQEDAPRPLLFLVLASALEEPAPAADWAALPAAAWTVAGPVSPPPAAWFDLAEAARGKRIGETALAALMVAAPSGTLSSDPVALSSAVSGLKQVGLPADARRLAVEAALAAGL